ncbi:hypothetical protein LMJF_29_1250 [Leishmania major strain Friedlin]|uniref:Uncharacterized protein n=1 Tax=Leishmania major TaxID=5664 RepID=E9ADY3_LEIMA|nr:hypothetical protein LMJF_29_1250 [Leishmania major strain Friedlin]CAG9577862.1 hypothetical_protein_-_conserved [Leishmania major strain Friedlin]CBZ12462.1 hypothetical protein LMJF_29_1250 [Leishmania major strain Friedlin]|eukprot:XP_003722204.1 hypothetical protein LMJF_29_1250 [Leishmania major strain Friedlin]
MPSTYAHEPDMRALLTITRCVSAMQHSKIQSCAALFSDAHDNLMRDSCASHVRVRREGEPTGYASGTREPLRGKQPSSTMRRTRWPKAARRGLAFEDSPAPPPPSFSKHAAHRECSAFFTSMRLAEEDIRVEEYVLGMNSDRNASGMRHGEAHDTQSAESRAYWSFGSLQQDRDLIRSGTDARGAHFSAFDAPAASRAASLVSPSGAAARTVLQLSTSRSHLQRQPPSPPPSGPQSAAAVATPGLGAHPLRLNISADVCSKNSRASNRRHLTLSSLSVSKVNDISCTTRTDSASAVDGLCHAGGFDLAQTSSARHSSHQALQRQPDCQDKHASSRPTRWMTSEEGEASLALLVQKTVHNGSAAPSVAASLSPPSVTAAVARNGRSVTSSDTEALRPSALPAGAYSPPRSSSASVASFYSHFFSSAERGGRRSTSRSTSMRREGRMYEAEATATGSGGTRALLHADPTAAEAGAAGSFALDARGHPADRRADDVNASAVRAASDGPQHATHAVSEKSPSVDCVPSRPAASSSLDLERYTLPVELLPLLSTTVLAVTASKASPAPFSSWSLRFSPPSAAAAVVAGEARVMGASSSQKSTRKSETANVRCRDVSHASASLSRASGLASASIAMAAKADARLAEAPPTPPDGLSRPEAANTGAARRQYPSPPPLPSPRPESSPGADMWRAGALVQRSLSLHGSRGAEPVSERVGETLLEPPACAESPSYSLPRRRRSPLEGAANMPDVVGRDAQSSVSAVAGTRDIAGPVQSVADGGQRKTLIDPAARLGPGEKIVHGFRGRQYAAPQSKTSDAADEPPTAVSEMEDDVPREADTRTAGDPMCCLAREVSEARRNEQQQQQQKQQKWHHYVMHAPPVRAPGASPPSRSSVVAASTHHRQTGVPLSTSLGVFSATTPPPLAQRGNCSLFLAGCGDDNASVRSPAIAARRGVQEAPDRTGSGCARCSPAASKLEAVELGHGGATAATAEAPEHSRLKPPALSHAAVASMGRSEVGRGLYRLHSDSGVRANDAGGEGFDNESRTNGTTARRPRRYHGDGESTTRHRVTADPAACHAPFDSLHSASADLDWVANDHAAQQRLQRFTGDAGPLAVPSSIDTAVTGSPSALADLAVREGFVRRGRVMGSQAPAAPLPTCGAVETEDLDQGDPTLSVRRADSCTSHFEVLLCTSFDSQTRYETPPHSPYTPVLGSSLTNRAGIPCMDSFASLEHTPLPQSVTSAAAMEGSATECDAPVMSTFFADDHVADAIPAAVAARQVTGGRDDDVADDVPATQGLVSGVEEKAEVHIRPHYVESDSGPGLHSSVERSSSLGSQNPDQPSCATQPAGRTFGDVGAEAAHPTSPTSSRTRNTLAACSHCTPLNSCLHSNSVSRAWPTHTCHAASASASRGLREAYTGPSSDLGTSEEPGNSDGDGVEDSLDDAPMLWDRHAPYPAPTLSIDGGDVYSSVPSASTRPPPPRGPLREPRQQVHWQRETSLLSSSSAHVNDAEDTVAALKSTVIAHGTGGCRAEAGEGSHRHVAPELSSSIASINAVSSVTTSSRLRRGYHPGERQEEKQEPNDVPETYTQRLQQWQQAQDNDVQPQALCRVLSSDFFASRSCPRRGSESTQPYDAEGGHGRGDMLDGHEHEPNRIVNDGGGGGEDCGDFAASAPSSLPSRAGSMQANALIGSAAAELREGRPSTASYSSTCATASATAVSAATAAKTPECRAPASWQRTRLSIPVVLSKPPIDAGASRRRRTNGLRRSSALPFSNGDSAVVSQAAGIYPRRQQAMTSAEVDSFSADADEDEDEDGGYCSYGYESDLVYV